MKGGIAAEILLLNFGIDSASVELVRSNLVRLEAEPDIEGCGLVLARCAGGAEQLRMDAK